MITVVGNAARLVAYLLATGTARNWRRLPDVLCCQVANVT